jgi:hypothetical protein
VNGALNGNTNIDKCEHTKNLQGGNHSLPKFVCHNVGGIQKNPAQIFKSYNTCVNLK